jgi:hypothetical protein
MLVPRYRGRVIDLSISLDNDYVLDRSDSTSGGSVRLLCHKNNEPLNMFSLSHVAHRPSSFVTFNLMHRNRSRSL